MLATGGHENLPSLTRENSRTIPEAAIFTIQCFSNWSRSETDKKSDEILQLKVIFFKELLHRPQLLHHQMMINVLTH